MTIPHKVTITKTGPNRFTARHADGRESRFDTHRGTLTINGREGKITYSDATRGLKGVRARVRDLYHCRERGYPVVTIRRRPSGYVPIIRPPEPTHD